MSLYLTIFQGDEEVEGWVFGHYSDFGVFRDAIAANLDAALYPILMLHSDCDGQWDVADLPELRRELTEIGTAFKKLPATPIGEGFEHTAEYRVRATSLYDCFHNVDGENIFEALLQLAEIADRRQLPILFQ